MTGAEPDIEAQTWQMALDFLLAAENGSFEATPRMVTHAAYYSMYDAARAVLIQVDGLRAPYQAQHCGRALRAVGQAGGQYRADGRWTTHKRDARGAAVVGL